MRTFISILMIMGVCAASFLPGRPVYAAPDHVESTNLLSNGGFEEGRFSPTGSPDHWSPEEYGSSAEFLWDDTQAYEGERSVKVTVQAAEDAGWFQTVKVQPNTNYRLSGWVKTDIGNDTGELEGGAMLSLWAWKYTSTMLVGTNDWTYVSFGFNSGEMTELTIAAHIAFWAGATTRTAWFDDLELAPILASDPHPSWKILVLIYDALDFTYTDPAGVEHRYSAQMTQEEKEQAAQTATTFVEEDIPALTSGNMIPTVTVRYPEHALTQLSPYGDGWWPSPWNIPEDLDPAFDSVIVLWDPWVLDDATGQITFIGGAAGLTVGMGTHQTYAAILVDAATWYGHRNVFRHEWGHSILYFYEAYGTAPLPAVNNHINNTDNQYVHCPTGEPYILEDETPGNPIPNSIYNNDSGFTHDYYSGTTATPDQPTRCLGITPEAWASGGPVSKPLRPPTSTTPTPIQQIQSIRDDIDQLVVSGDLKAGHAKSLYARLDAATRALEDERNKKAVKSLQLFIKKVEKLMKTHHLPKEKGRALVDQATDLIDQLTE